MTDQRLLFSSLRTDIASTSLKKDRKYLDQ
jgi:hypothetical protein